MVKGRLPTINLLQRRGMIFPNACPLCLHDAKSINHIFIHCPFASEIWEMFLKEIGLSWVFPNRVISLIASWNIWRVSKKGCTLWNSIYLAVYWLIWPERNKKVFEGCMEPAYNVFCRERSWHAFGAWMVRIWGTTRWWILNRSGDLYYFIFSLLFLLFVWLVIFGDFSSLFF